MASVRFHLPNETREHVRVAYHPLLEAVFSLCVLADPQHYPLRHAWARQTMRALPTAVRRELTACSFALGKWSSTRQRWLPTPIVRFDDQTTNSFAESLEDLQALAPETVTAELAPLGVACEDGLSRESRRALLQARGDPSAFWGRLCNLLEAYWETAFATEWDRLEPHLAESVIEAERLLDHAGLRGFVATLGPRVRLARGRRGFRLELWLCPQPGSETPWSPLADADVQILDTFTFVPSTFTGPRVWANMDPAWPIGMTYHAPSVARQGRPRIPPADLVRMLRACGDEVRLRALRWIAESPRSTQELAPLVGITEAAMSKHLRQLTEAGVLESNREGRYVLYRLRPDRLKLLPESLFAYLRS